MTVPESELKSLVDGVLAALAGSEEFQQNLDFLYVSLRDKHHRTDEYLVEHLDQLVAKFGAMAESRVANGALVEVFLKFWANFALEESNAHFFAENESLKAALTHIIRLGYGETETAAQLKHVLMLVFQNVLYCIGEEDIPSLVDGQLFELFVGIGGSSAEPTSFIAACNILETVLASKTCPFAVSHEVLQRYLDLVLVFFEQDDDADDEQDETLVHLVALMAEKTTDLVQLQDSTGLLRSFYHFGAVCPQALDCQKKLLTILGVISADSEYPLVLRSSKEFLSKPYLAVCNLIVMGNAVRNAADLVSVSSEFIQDEWATFTSVVLRLNDDIVLLQGLFFFKKVWRSALNEFVSSNWKSSLALLGDRFITKTLVTYFEPVVQIYFDFLGKVVDNLELSHLVQIVEDEKKFEVFGRLLQEMRSEHFEAKFQLSIKCQMTVYKLLASVLAKCSDLDIKGHNLELCVASFLAPQSQLQETSSATTKTVPFVYIFERSKILGMLVSIRWDLFKESTGEQVKLVLMLRELKEYLDLAKEQNGSEVESIRALENNLKFCGTVLRRKVGGSVELYAIAEQLAAL